VNKGSLPSYIWKSVFTGPRGTIDTKVHPDYVTSLGDWQKYRLTFESGDPFIASYLKRFSVREDNKDFADRRSITYCPSHAKSAIIDIKNAIYQRMIDIVRNGGATSYAAAVKGEQRGVDMQGNTMTGYIGRLVLPELLSMGKVGVFVDKPVMEDAPSINDARRIRPYLYIYTAEDIRSWRYDTQNNLLSVLLRDNLEVVDEETGLVADFTKQFRLLNLTENGVVSRIYDDKGQEVESMTLELTRIPLVIFELSQSLLVDVANYQIALLNMSSSDINYILKANFPFYTEQYDMMAEMTDLRQASAIVSEDSSNTTASVEAGTAETAAKAKDREIKVGTTKGRRYPKGIERPGFINPSAEPLLASMKKQDQLRSEIKELVNLAVTNVTSKSASAESKKMDEHSLEAGLSNIGLELEYGEKEIAFIWNQFEGFKGETVVKYPNNYSLKTDEDRRKEAKEMMEELPTIPSKTYQQEMAKQITTITLGNKVTDEKLKQIHQEIEQSAVVVTDPDVIQQDHEAGFVSTVMASELRGYPKGQAAAAKKDHADRVARIAAAQQRAAARGVPDNDDDPTSGRKEKKLSRHTDGDDVVKTKVRGEGQ